jgi:hypothetical protein
MVVATVIGYAPGEILRHDPRAAKLQAQIEELEVEERGLAKDNTVLARDIHALQTDVSAIEDRARADLGMVYPDEIVLRVERPVMAPIPLVPVAPAPPRGAR